MNDRSIEAFLATFQSPRTREAYAGSIRRLQDAIGRTDVRDASPDEIAVAADRYRRKAKPATWNILVSAWRSYYAYLVDTGTNDRNPALRLKRRPPRPAEREIPSTADVRALWRTLTNPATWLESTDEGRAIILRDRAFFALMTGAGIRASEMCALNVGDFSDDRSAQWAAKGDVVRTAAFSPSSWAHILPLLSGREPSSPFLYSDRGVKSKIRLTRHGLNRILAFVCECAGVQRYTTHAFRHYAITAALDAGMSLRDVAKAVGHASAMTTELYDHGKPQPLKGTENGLDHTDRR